METLTVSIDNPAETVGLLKEALAKEKFFLQLGIEKTQARIRQFEQRYAANLNHILDQEREIDHVVYEVNPSSQICPNGKAKQKSYGD